MGIKDIRLKKGMTNEDVNKLISEWLLLEDDIFKSSKHNHSWRCKCGNIIEDRNWDNIRFRKSIDCGCMEYNKQESRYEYEVEKDGDYEYIRSYRTGDVLPNGKIVKYESYIQVKHKYCGSIYTVGTSKFINCKVRCSKCCGSYKNSFAHYIEQELGETLDKYWDFEKNTVNPYNISKCRNGKDKEGNNLKVWIKCTKTDYHDSYEISCNNFTRRILNNNNRCPYCTSKIIHPKDSFARYHIDNTDPDFLEKYWDYDKNTVSPWEVSPSSNKHKVWIKCQNEEINELNGLMKKDYHGGYEVSCASFTVGNRCSYCHSRKVHPYDSIKYTHSDVAKMIVKNKINIETISKGSHLKFHFKCQKCGSISDETKELKSVISQGYSCKCCSDGFSVPEKFMSNVLKQLNVEFIKEFGRNNVIWIKDRCRYDFYIPSLNIIIEIHGLQHYKWQGRGRSLKEEQENDRIKKELALSNGIINYIVIDCRYSKLEWLKENITKELSLYFDLSNIDWNLAWEESQNSLCVKTWELWNSGCSRKMISNELQLHISTVIGYLNDGIMCGYVKFVKYFGKKITICLTTKKIFNTITEASKYHDIGRVNIVSNCKGKRNYCGKLQNETPLVWRYLVVNHNRKYRSNEMYKLHSKQIESIVA